MSSFTKHRNKDFFCCCCNLDSAYFTAELTNKTLFYTFELKSSLEVCSSVMCFPSTAKQIVFHQTLLPSHTTARGWCGSFSLQARKLVTLAPPEWALFKGMVPTFKHLNNNTVHF